ncbi:hypothetical protein ACFX2I_014496 [Malus domestica]
MATYWNVMFDDVEVGTDATSEDKSKGVAEADKDFEAIFSSRLKKKARKEYRTHVGALPLSSRLVFEEFLVTVEVRLKTVVEALEEKWCACMELAAKLECLRSDAPRESFDKPSTLEKSGKDIALATNLPTFDVDLSEIIEVENANDIAQSLLRILQFRVNCELEERQVFLQEKEDTEVSEHGTYTDESVNVNEAIDLSGSKPLHGKGMWQKCKGMQLVHPFTFFESYKRRKVGNGCSAEDFVIVMEPMQIILKPDVEEKMKQEYAQFETLVAGIGKGKSKAKAKKAPIFTPSKHLMKVVSADATVTLHMCAWNDVDQVFIPCHVNGDRMLADVHLLLCTITIYDSYWSRSGW